MLRRVTGLPQALWQYAVVRYFCIHVPLGTFCAKLSTNLDAAGAGLALANLLTYGPYIIIGFFIDRLITYRSPETKTTAGMPAYLTNEGLALACTILAMTMLIYTGGARLVLETEPGEWLVDFFIEVLEFEREDPEKVIARGPFGLPFSGMISFLLNRYITFRLIPYLFPRKEG